MKIARIAIVFVLFWSSWVTAQDQAGKYFGRLCSGSILQNKILQFYRASDTTATGLVATDTTDAEGRWDVNLPGTGNYRMYSVTDGFWFDRFSWVENYGYGIDVKFYGAKGDGVTDDRAAIQSAINALPAGGGVVFFPVGDFRITAALTIDATKGVWLLGSGWFTGAAGSGGSRILNQGTGNALTIGSAAADRTADVRILGLMIEGQAGTGHGIQVNRVHNFRIEGCRIRNHAGDGINLQGCYASWIHDNYVNNNTGSGIKLVALAAAGNDFIDIRGNRCLANGAKGIWIDNTARAGTGGKVTVNDIEGNAVGLQMDAGSAGNSDAWAVDHNYFENQTGLNANIGTDAGTGVFRGLSLYSNTFNPGTASAAANAVALDRVQNADIRNNLFSTTNVTMTAGTIVSLWSGNVGPSSTFPAGFTNGLPSFKQFNLRDSDGSGFSTVSMDNGVVSVNYKWKSTGLILTRTAPTYGATVSIDANLGNEFDITVTDGNAFTINNPANGNDGSRITITVRNAFGVMGAITWGGNYKMSAWTNPANGFSRSIDFRYNGTLWVQVGQTGVDVPN